MNGTDTLIISISVPFHVINSNKVLLNAYEYDSFGNILPSVEKIHNRFTYTGELHEPISSELCPYYYFKYPLTEFPKCCDDKGNKVL